ncbi:putative thioesterase [Actinoalloteichus sp. GBA129-24]|uniref:Thioesterase n=2 Tax=Pseudonocardiaceae TaxID=2070 RepID=A0AAC9PR20_9PSEU|nr:putative thioesterase [Actinoalloteichus fjordicus]APU19589.1 putative thioesterase [Actinoalloteichus sp. GBA129-24]
MGVYVADVTPRWSDMDAFGHVNHANTVTLLEEARVGLLFVEGGRRGEVEMADGTVVARLRVDYLRPLVVDGASVRVEIAVDELRAASFTLVYVLRSGRSPDDPIAATAETVMVPYDLAGGRPRRLTDTERDFLAGWRAKLPTGRPQAVNSRG